MNDPDFVCALCDTDVFCLPAPPDDSPVCLTCRIFCGMERRWFGGVDPFGRCGESPPAGDDGSGVLS